MAEVATAITRDDLFDQADIGHCVILEATRLDFLGSVQDVICHVEVSSCHVFDRRKALVKSRRCVDLVDDNGQLLSRGQYTPRIGQPAAKMPYLKEGPWISDIKNYPTVLKAVRESDWIKQDDGAYACKVAVQNVGNRPAYQVSLAVPGNEEFMKYSDNFFWLEAGEKRFVEICISSKEPPDVQVSAWNANKTTPQS